MSVDEPVPEVTPDALCGQTVQRWLEPFWSFALFELECACVLIVGPYHDVVASPPLNHTGSFRLHHGVDATDLVAHLPRKLKEKA